MSLQAQVACTFSKNILICKIVQKLLKRQWANCVSWSWFLSFFSSASFMKLAIQRTPGLPKFPWLLQMVCLSVLGSSLSLTASTGSSTGGAVVVVGNSSSSSLRLSLYHLRSRGPLSFIFSLSLSSFSICKMQWQLSPEELAGLQLTQLLLPELATATCLTSGPHCSKLFCQNLSYVFPRHHCFPYVK